MRHGVSALSAPRGGPRLPSACARQHGGTFSNITCAAPYPPLSGGHCKKLTPEYEQAANLLKTSGSMRRLAKLDATTERGPATKHEIRGFPTLKLFK